MIVHVFNEQHALKFSVARVKKVVQQVIQEEGQTCHEVSLYFVETPAICELHETYFNDPSPTDCVSFPMDEIDDALDYRILGDVFVCPATALEYSQLHQTDPYEETTLYIVHGLLHLMGYRDIEEKDIQLIRQAEKRHMKKLKELDLYLKPMVK